MVSDSCRALVYLELPSYTASYAVASDIWQVPGTSRPCMRASPVHDGRDGEGGARTAATDGRCAFTRRPHRRSEVPWATMVWERVVVRCLSRRIGGVGVVRSVVIDERCRE